MVRKLGLCPGFPLVMEFLESHGTSMQPVSDRNSENLMFLWMKAQAISGHLVLPNM